MPRLLKVLSRAFLTGFALFAAGALVMIVTLMQEQAGARREARENFTNFAAQVDYELLTLIDDLDRIGDGAPGVGRDHLVNRFNVFWSRLETASTGPIGRKYMALPGARQAIAESARVLEEIEASVLSLEPGDARAADRLKAALRPLVPLVHAVTLESVMTQAALREQMFANRESQQAYMLAFLSFGLAQGLVAILILWAERRQLRRLSRDLERQVAERGEALERTEMLFRAIVAASPAEIFVRDSHGRYLMANRAWESAHGLTEAEVTGKTDWDVLPKPLADRNMKQDFIVLQSGEPLEEELEQVLRGTSRIVNAVKFPVIDASGAVIGVGGIGTDVTRLRATEDRLNRAQKMEAVGQLTGGIAHDFNNLLAVIQGNAELLSERAGMVEDEFRTLVGPILQAATRGAELTRRLLAFSRQQPLHPRAIAPGELVQGMLGMLGRTLGETIAVETAVAPGLWRALADPGQVENAVLNLAINARDAMPEAGRLLIECANITIEPDQAGGGNELSPGDYVVIAVTDTGTGMPPEVRARAFEPFFTTKEVGRGTGLGLSMVYGFAKQSGGHVALYSETGRGTSVKLYLPRTAVAALPAAAPKADLPRGQGESILVIEDDLDVRTMTVRMLEELDYRVIDVANAAQARVIVESDQPIDLMLSDVVLPGGTSGPQFAAEARSIRPGLKVIYMSGYSPEAAMRNGLLEPDSLLLSKPFQRKEIVEAMSRKLAGGRT